jgi:hypothetical protein
MKLCKGIDVEILEMQEVLKMEILKCPECGKQPKLSSLEPEFNSMKYFCSVHASCGDWKNTEELAAKDWNRRVNEWIEESKKPKRITSKEALYVLLYDQYDTVDMEVNQSDERYVDIIIGALIEVNDDTCPFKKYDCIENCEHDTGKCASRISIDCGREKELVWKEFILLNNKEV